MHRENINSCPIDIPYTTTIKLRMDAAISSKYTCGQCNCDFADRRSLMRHDKSTHGDSLFYSCGQCDYKTTQKYHLMRHRNSKHK